MPWPKLLKVWIVSPALILAFALAVRPLFLVGLLTLLAYLLFGVPVSHLVRSVARRSGPVGAFGPGVVACTSTFVALVTLSSVVSTRWYDGSGHPEQPNFLLAMGIAGVAGVLMTAVATLLADWLVTLLERGRQAPRPK